MYGKDCQTNTNSMTDYQNARNQRTGGKNIKKKCSRRSCSLHTDVVRTTDWHWHAKAELGPKQCKANISHTLNITLSSHLIHFKLDVKFEICPSAAARQFKLGDSCWTIMLITPLKINTTWKLCSVLYPLGFFLLPHTQPSLPTHAKFNNEWNSQIHFTGFMDFHCF